MDGEQLDDLTRRATAGDRTAVDALLAHYLPELRAFVRLRVDGRLRRRESTSDLVQSACREVLEHAGRFRYDQEAAFRRWLFTTALRKIHDRREHHLAARRDVRREAADDEALLACYGGLASPSGAAATHEEIERVERAMEALPAEYREVLTLARIAGLSRSEIAQQMGRSEGSVRMLLHRALARLVAQLEVPRDV